VDHWISWSLSIEEAAIIFRKYRNEVWGIIDCSQIGDGRLFLNAEGN
jgi:hypothetical protein